MKTVARSLGHMHWKLYVALLAMGFCPTVYTTVRTFFLGQLPGEWAFSIAGQLSWVNLLYEVLNEAILLPLYFFLGAAGKDRAEFTNRLRSGLLVTFAVFSLLSASVIVFVKPLLRLMAASAEILPASAAYIRVESVANVFGVLFGFACVALVAVGKARSVWLLTGAKLLLCVGFDTFLVSSLPFSARLGIQGVGISNLAVNACLLAVSLRLLEKEGFRVFAGGRPSFAWLRSFAAVGGVSGAESLVRNLAYMLMVSRMVNLVGEQGTYWVANNFIWGWLLLPILQLGELIKQETANDPQAVRDHTLGYFAVTGAVCMLWFAAIPLYRPFLRYVLNFGETEKLFELVMLLLGSYVFFAFQNVFDMTFYGRGKTKYMLLEAVVTNAVYYGAFFAMYRTGAWVPSLTGIALLFGGGNVFDSVVSGVVYARFLKKNRVRITDVREAGT